MRLSSDSRPPWYPAHMVRISLVEASPSVPVSTACDVELLLEGRLAGLRDGLGIRIADHAQRDHVSDEVLANRRLAVDALVHLRLRVAGLVALVVPVPPVAVHIDDDVTPPAASELHRQLDDLSDRIRVLAVHVEHRDLEQLGDVRRVA